MGGGNGLSGSIGAIFENKADPWGSNISAEKESKYGRNLMKFIVTL